MPALVQVFTADLRQPAKADDLEPLHSLTRSTVSVLPPFVDSKAESTDRGAFLAEPKFRCITKKPDQGYLVHTLAHEFCPPSSSNRNFRLTRSPASTSISVASSAMPSRTRVRIIGMFRRASVFI